jgi:hypothetical protein
MTRNEIITTLSTVFCLISIYYGAKIILVSDETLYRLVGAVFLGVGTVLLINDVQQLL